MTAFKKLYPVFLMALALIIGCKKSNYNFNDLPPTVVSNFTVSKATVEMDEEIKFSNKSANADSYAWDFGDGTSSTEKDPAKVYPKAGIYTVILKAVGKGGTGNFSKIITVKDNRPGSGGMMYYIEYGAKAIQKVSLSPGSTPELVTDITGKAGVGLAYDATNEKIYFTDFENTDDGKVWRMNLDGTNLQQLVSGIDDPYSLVVNLAGGKIYWADDAGNISRANLDGSNLEREFIHIADGQMRGIAFSNKNNIIYFYEVNNEDLYVANANGTGVTKLITGAYGYGIFVDDVNGKLYYEDRNKTSIMRANQDGSGIVKIADVPSTRVHGMAIDYVENKLYWTDRDKGFIKRSNLDGTSVENFLPGLKSPRGLFLK